MKGGVGKEERKKKRLFLPSKASSPNPAHLAGCLLLLGAEILRHFPTACGEVEDGSGSHVSSLSVVGVVKACGGR